MFTLLETVYGSFDRIAERRGGKKRLQDRRVTLRVTLTQMERFLPSSYNIPVFKVETGECFIATTIEHGVCALRLTLRLFPYSR